MKGDGLLNGWGKQLTVVGAMVAALLPTGLWGNGSGELVLEQSADMESWEAVELTPEMITAEGKIALSELPDPVFFRLEVSDFAVDPVPEGFALIPAGSFSMGDALEDGYADELPVHEVTLTAFYLGTHEVTKAKWDEIRTWAEGSALGYTDLPEGDGKAADHPVQHVSWFDAVKWLNAWSEKEGLTPVYTVSGGVMRSGTDAPSIDYGANGYRLPSEAEWEKAARGGLSGKRFPWGDTITHADANYRANGSAYTYDESPYTTDTHHPDYNDGSIPYTSPVGAFAANGYGLYDMAGNVWEWCNDWYGGGYSSSPATDPTGPESGSLRVVRGGSWNSYAFDRRVSNRVYSGPADRHGSGFGFRPARSSVP